MEYRITHSINEENGTRDDAMIFARKFLSHAIVIGDDVLKNHYNTKPLRNPRHLSTAVYANCHT